MLSQSFTVNTTLFEFLHFTKIFPSKNFTGAFTRKNLPMIDEIENFHDTFWVFNFANFFPAVVEGFVGMTLGLGS